MAVAAATGLKHIWNRLRHVISKWFDKMDDDDDPVHAISRRVAMTLNKTDSAS